MTYLLDTNACIIYLNGTNDGLVKRLLSTPPRALAMSSLTFAELRFGAATSSRPRANQARVKAFAAELRCIPFDEACAARFGTLKASLWAAGTPIPDFDVGIAATALVHDRALVSADRHMRSVPDLMLEDWTS